MSIITQLVPSQTYYNNYLNTGVIQITNTDDTGYVNINYLEYLNNQTPNVNTDTPSQVELPANDVLAFQYLVNNVIANQASTIAGLQGQLTSLSTQLGLLQTQVSTINTTVNTLKTTSGVTVLGTKLL